MRRFPGCEDDLSEGFSPERRRHVVATTVACAWTLLSASASHAGPYPDVPDPGGDPNAIVAVPPEGGQFFGYHENSWDVPNRHGWNADELAEIAQGGGANTTRFSLTWQMVEPRPDVWDENGMGPLREHVQRARPAGRCDR